MPKRIIIVGAGMAGLCAALQARELGADVEVLEKGDVPGGSLAMSGGTLWCAASYEDLRRLVPRGDPLLARALVDDYADGVSYLQAHGAVLTRLPSLPDRITYLMEPNPRAFVSDMLAGLNRMGVVPRTGTCAEHLLRDSDGHVAGVRARGPDGVLRDLRADAVVLASGGFQGNREMAARYFGRWSDRLVLRGSPNNTGDGFIMGSAAGAAPSAGMSSFYGHLIPAPPASVPVNDFIAYTQYHSEHAVLVNLRGERFCDESLGDETSCQAVAREPEALAFVLFDHTVYRNFAVRPAGGGARASDTFYESLALGAPGGTAATIEELCSGLELHGVHAAGALATLREFNAAALAGTAARLRIPRRARANALTQPPFYALGLTPGITFTLGGLRINAQAQVLDRAQRVIPGLYAAGADAGGIHNEQYAGGLCLGLVFGRRAARHAVAGA